MEQEGDIRDEHGLVLPCVEQGPVGAIGNGKDVRSHLVPGATAVNVDDLWGVDWESLVGVHHHQEETRVGLYDRTHQPTKMSMNVLNFQEFDRENASHRNPGGGVRETGRRRNAS